MMGKPDRHGAAEIVRDAGGEIVGRTRLQKVAYLLELAGFGDGFQFEYRHYGPYSEDLADAIRLADAYDLVQEVEHKATWGGTYSIFRVKEGAEATEARDRTAFVQKAAGIDAIELELAATAAYLASAENSEDPWGETARRKPDKADNGRLEKAKAAYRELLTIRTPAQLPQIA
jgi:uncharacterized protein YwgA